MLYLVVIVTEGIIKCVLPERIITITENEQFSELYEIFTSGQFNNQNVKVYVRQNRHHTEHTRRDLLYNEIIDLLRNQKAGWKGGVHQTLGKEFVERIANAIWYIDPHLKLLQSRSCHIPVLFKELATYANDDPDINTYNLAYRTTHHKKEPISHQKLDLLIKSLELLIGQPWVNDNEWNNIIPAIIALVDMMRKYSEHLVKSKTIMATIHHNDESTRNPTNNSRMFRVLGCKENDLNEQYQELNDVILQCGFYQYMDVYSYLPIDIMKRYRYLKHLQLTCSIGIYRYAQGNYLGTITYIWKIPESEATDEFQDETQKFICWQKFMKDCLITPAILRMLYFDLTGDAAVTANIISREIEERLHLMMALEDPSITFDLRTNNGFKGNKFDIFWTELDMYFNEETPAVDDRYHDTIMHMPLAISIRDLHDIILARLHIKNGRYQVKFKVQSRLLYKKSVDAHYCAAIFHYLCEFLIQYQQWACFISADDKHKVPIGEDVPVSTGVRNCRSLTTQKNDLNASDHDFTKLSLTPSVIFFVSIPSDISGGFYSGQVFVSFKDTVFEPSSAIRHATEFHNAIDIKYTHQTSPPILCLYTDGGPDHRCTYGSVQIALISLFLSGNYDMLIAVRTAPHHSWTNLAERIMSILNLGLQNVSIMRNTMSDESEALFDKADTLDEIRNKASKNSNLEKELRDCIKDVQNLLHNHSEKLVLKNQYFKCYNAANKHDINSLFQSILKVDPSLIRSEITQAQLTRHTELISFMKTHCHKRVYSFQIKKCQNVLCDICTPIRLPQTIFDNLYFLPDPTPALDSPEHYSSFQAVYGKQTSEEFRPSLQLNQANAEPAPKSVLVSAKILFVRVKISCDTPVEILYYSSQKSGNFDICYYCGTDSDFVDPPSILRTKYKIIYPLCQGCQDKGKEFSTRIEVKVNNNNSKQRKIS
ncbi:hypothetical protein RhiirA5_408735 [Rhizophagus irregularis]|uniref:Uncharacterized protein n=1 Tax=Rhizophagus irregularis TaxID=588596 RepID=A0A2N0Q7L0_9GLOM|nr:hypothetical protein RhiirA5_408735 [Rhizophagus irregularis]